MLPTHLVRAAIIDELKYFNDRVWKFLSAAEARKLYPHGTFVGGRWVTHNKGDADQPKCRGRYVAQEVNKGGEADAAFYAATPPLEAKRVLFSRFASERHHNKKPLKLHFLDVRKAYFNGIPRRSMYLRLPSELGLHKNTLGELRRCIYGTRDAGALWEATYTHV